MNRGVGPSARLSRRKRTQRIGTAIISLGHAERYARRRLVWNRVYRAVSYAKSALWIVPFVAIVLVLALAPVLRALDARLGWEFAGLAVSGAQALYQTIITLTLSFLVFTFGSLLVAIQVAGGQLTPRIIATTLLRDNVVRYSVGLFVFTLLFAVLALNRLETHVQQLITFVGAVLGIACMAMFLFLIDYAARLLRPVSIAARVGDEGLAVIESVYPEAVDEAEEAESSGARRGKPARVVRHLGKSAIVLAADLTTLVAEAKRTGGLVELVPQVGDFIANEEPLFALYGGAASIADRTLYATVAIGRERTLEQDPMFAFRILVDIALKALSAAINDPTTATLAIDQIHRLLRAVGRRHLLRDEIYDDRGDVRVIYRTPNWEDYVHVACREIRSCGAGSVQVARRLFAMLDNLARSLPPHRRAALGEERRHLETMIDRLYPIAEDRALARIPDPQGLGGSSGARVPNVP
ncbi:MAG: DUF2254 domain-containing protein [Rudaea sp.]